MTYKKSSTGEWAVSQQSPPTPRQQRNMLQVIDIKYIEFGGTGMSLRNWSRQLGLNYTTLYHRLRKGWTVERTLTTRPYTRQVCSEDEVLDAIRYHWENDGEAPSIHKLQSTLQVRDPRTVRIHLDSLEETGHIYRDRLGFPGMTQDGIARAVQYARSGGQKSQESND